jgi:hypothetical protein
MTETVRKAAHPGALGCPRWCTVDHAASDATGTAAAMRQEVRFHLGEKIIVDSGYKPVTVQPCLTDGGYGVERSVCVDGAVGHPFSQEGARRFALALLDALDQLEAQ